VVGEQAHCFTPSSTQRDDGNSAENFRILKSGKQRMDVERGVDATAPSHRALHWRGDGGTAENGGFEYRRTAKDRGGTKPSVLEKPPTLTEAGRPVLHPAFRRDGLDGVMPGIGAVVAVDLAQHFERHSQ